MKIFNANITPAAAELLLSLTRQFDNYSTVNEKLQDRFGIAGFFQNHADYTTLKQELKSFRGIASDHSQIEYGDFQTPPSLAESICKFLYNRKITPKILVEPTCGKGNFIISSLKYFETIEYVYGIEINQAYVWECKFNLIDFFLNHPGTGKKKIHLFQGNIFGFDLSSLKQKPENGNDEVLVLGNPPWVTNTTLASLNSGNLPGKSNFKNYSGIDAITGKGNFDISEYIALMMMNHFSKQDGHFAFLIKNSIIKNIVYDLKRNHFRVNNLEKLTINAKKEFNVTVDASLFFCTFNQAPALYCREKDFYSLDAGTRIFGWVGEKFAADLEKYKAHRDFDGKSPLVWRSGIKHDLARVMELEKINGKYVNRLHEEIELEDDPVYEFLKSSDLKKKVITCSRRYIILTQKKISQDTSYLERFYPLTYRYLQGKEHLFQARRSSIYKNKPRFSIFGVGDYSFKKYKVAISGLYKNSTFSLIIPPGEKPILLDDTCYFLGFDELLHALFTYLLLECRETQDFLKSLVFLDDKRAYTKDLLMRIDLREIARVISFDEIKKRAESVLPGFTGELNRDAWTRYLKNLSAGGDNHVQRKLLPVDEEW